MSRYYEFYLRGEGGKYDYDSRIVLPSVTTIVSTVLAKPQLVDWAYRTTLDAISYYFREVLSAHEVNQAEFLDTFSDPDMLDEWIRESGIHHSDFTEEASERGKRAHRFMARWAGLYLDKQQGLEIATRHAERLAETARDPYVRAVAKWIIQRKPVPILSEKVIYSFQRGGYAGRFDLLAELPFGQESSSSELTLLDLKTRRADLRMYDSDQAQLRLYEAALVERTEYRPRKVVVLLASEDDEPAREEVVNLPAEAALALVDVYYAKRKTRVGESRG